jgi:hypothetical protein
MAITNHERVGKMLDLLIKIRPRRTTHTALGSAGRLLAAVSAPQADEIEKIKMELLRLRFDEQVRTEKRKSTGTAGDREPGSN